MRRAKKKKGEIRKSRRLWEIELANSIKDRKNFKYFSNNKKQNSSIGPLHLESDIITTNMENGKILNNDFGNNVPEFNLSYRKKIEDPMIYFRINK